MSGETVSLIENGKMKLRCGGGFIICPATEERRHINTFFRQHDNSGCFPINGRFNVTERAIRRLQRKRKQGHYVPECGYEYAMALEMEIVSIVNNENFCQRG